MTSAMSLIRSFISRFRGITTLRRLTPPPRRRACPGEAGEQQESRGEGVVVLKDPASGRFFRLREPEHFIAEQLDGRTALEVVRHRAEVKFGKPLARATLEQFLEKLRRLDLLGEQGG